MPNPYFRFKQFTISHDRCAMKVTTDACLFGAWCAEKIGNRLPGKVLDVGTGTGLLALMIAQKSADKIDAVEIEADAATQARDNVLASPWKDQISVINADVLQWQAMDHYDFIVSNPPFYEREIIAASNKANLAHHSAALRLQDLFENLRERSAPGGRLYLLLPAKRESEAKKLLSRYGWYIHQLLYAKQTTVHTPFRLLLEVASEPSRITETCSLSIKTEEGNYSGDFIDLLKDYYLNLK